MGRIHAIERHPLAGAPPHGAGFQIADTVTGSISTGIVADAATCPDCLAEISDPSNRRYRYPFTNCTHCGPRLTIIRSLPYDRASTSMSAFAMCPDCLREYDDPADRRFHAEPNACPACGPRLWLEDGAGRRLGGEDVIMEAAGLLRAGHILAIKGLGGFHLACLAADAAAVARLRQRKHRDAKPLALMASDLSMIRSIARATEEEAAALTSPAAPIVILERLATATPLPAQLAPGQSTLGIMLPYTPLHHLLMRALGRPIVLTSGNRSDEPQCTSNADARNRLAEIADYWLVHDREIVNRVDDSVVRMLDGAPAVLRRGRGFAPEPLVLPADMNGPRVLALGAELKSTFCLLSEDRAVLSQHIGDLQDVATHSDYRSTLNLYRDIYRFVPEIIAIDMHPGYHSSHFGRELARETGASVIEVQHHHAHIAALLAEHGTALDARPVLGLAWDGLGFGDDGELWGGEFLLADYRGFRRLASFASVPLIGGDRAAHEPWRNAFAHLHHALGWEAVARDYGDLDCIGKLRQRRPDRLAQIISARLNAPPASSAGRLLDAAAAMLGVAADRVSYEGQAAIELENLAAQNWDLITEGYPVEIEEGQPIRLTWAPFWRALLTDLSRNVDPATIAARIHRGLIEAALALVQRFCEEHGAHTAALSGGVFQNRLLLEGISAALRVRGLAVLTPHRIPANDGGIAIGQAAVARARHLRAER